MLGTPAVMPWWRAGSIGPVITTMLSRLCQFSIISGLGDRPLTPLTMPTWRHSELFIRYRLLKLCICKCCVNRSGLPEVAHANCITFYWTCAGFESNQSAVECRGLSWIKLRPFPLWPLQIHRSSLFLHLIRKLKTKYLDKVSLCYTSSSLRAS